MTAIKERLLKKALQRELLGQYEEDKYGSRCLSCGVYNPTGKIAKHLKRCGTAQIERILSID